jgi:hypothetical protein
VIKKKWEGRPLYLIHNNEIYFISNGRAANGPLMRILSSTIKGLIYISTPELFTGSHSMNSVLLRRRDENSLPAEGRLASCIIHGNYNIPQKQIDAIFIFINFRESSVYSCGDIFMH